jgi:hypothetical protein
MPVNDFAGLIARCKSFSDVFRAFGIGIGGNNFDTVKKRCVEDGISTAHFCGKEISQKKLWTEAIPLSVVLVRNSTYSRRSLKQRLLREGILKNECIICGLSGDWNGKTLKMILDHINGVPDDHRIENLQMVCPNCNSQLETFTGKNKPRRERKNCIVCGRKIFHRSTKCRKCSNEGKFGKARRAKWPKYEDLVKEISETNRCVVARRLGVSETAVRKMLGRMEHHNT